MEDEIIQFRDFSFRYASQKEPTLKHINLTIRRGEKILLLGPSGSGKSTLANCMNGLIPESYPGEITGNCKIAGISLREGTVLKLSRLVGTVLQDSDAQFVGLSVGEDIAFSLENRNVPRKNMLWMVKKAAEKVGIASLLNHLPYNLSGGQKQKAALAGVLHEKVDILLFDEPLASLDPKAGMDTIDLIDQLHRDLGVTVVIVEHRLEDVLYRSVDRIILLDDGQIAASGTPDEILSSSVLQKHGIREPLYLSAIKDIGGGLRQRKHLSNLDSINLEPYRSAFVNFSKNYPVRKYPAAGKPLIELENVDFSYGDEPVLKNISLTIRQGERIALIGENGAGKSTLAKLICGVIRPRRGKIRIDGKDSLPMSIQELARKIGFVMQDPNQMLVKDIVQNEVRLALELRKYDEKTISRETEIVLKLTGLYPMRHWPIGALSYGQRKRVTIASILVLRPQCMILDEPTAGQDYAHYTEIMEFIQKLNDSLGMTVIFITHDMHLALEYTDRALVLSGGRLIGDGPVYGILSNDRMIEKASLKKTSIFLLAQKLGLDPPSFAEKFVTFERERRRDKISE